MIPKRIYIERNARPKWLLPDVESGTVEFIHFPYDSDSTLPRGNKIGLPSISRCNETHLGCDQVSELRYSDFIGPSEKFEAILAIVGKKNRGDALHLDSACKSKCDIFLTKDKTDILDHRDQLYELLGIYCFHPDKDKQQIKNQLQYDDHK